MIKIAILGLGTVGTGVVKVVEANTAPIQHKLGQPLSVKTALVRKLRADPYQHLMTENFREIEHDGEIRVVVETIGGVEAAYEYTAGASWQASTWSQPTSSLWRSMAASCWIWPGKTM